MQAASLERIPEVAAIVRRENDERRNGRGDRPDLGNRDLKIRENFEKKRFELLIRFIDLVDEQHGAVLLAERREERARFEKLLGEKHVVEIADLLERFGDRLDSTQARAVRIFENLRVEELLAVLPLVQRLRFVEPLVTLHPNERKIEVVGGGARELRLPDAGRSFHEDRLAQVAGEIDGRRRLAIADIVRADQSGLNGLDRPGVGTHGFAHVRRGFPRRERTAF